MLPAQVLDEINETTDQMRQLQDALGAPTGLAADLDEDELLGELAEIEEAVSRGGCSACALSLLLEHTK